VKSSDCVRVSSLFVEVRVPLQPNLVTIPIQAQLSSAQADCATAKQACWGSVAKLGQGNSSPRRYVRSERARHNSPELRAGN
jgi:hypothetical protein